MCRITPARTGYVRPDDELLVDFKPDEEDEPEEDEEDWYPVDAAVYPADGPVGNGEE